YSDGVRALLRAGNKLSGLIGPVPQLGIVPAGMELALEAALGPYVQAVVVQNLKHAQQCLDYLHNAKAGKAMVAWLERENDEDEDDGEVEQIQEQEEMAVLQRFVDAVPDLKEHIFGFAARIIQYEPRYKTLFRRMLRGAVITRDLTTAHELLGWVLHLSISGDNDLPFQSVITLKGEVLHVDGWLTGGSGKDAGAQQGLLAYERELRELPQQLEQHKTLIDQLNGMLSEVQRAQEGRRAEQNTLDKELQRMISRINELTKVVNNSQRDYERLQTEIQLAASVEQQLASEVAGLEQEVVDGQKRVQAHEKSQREMSGLV